MKAITINHWDQMLAGEVALTLKRCQGGDDYPLVLIVYKDEDTDDEDADRETIF